MPTLNLNIDCTCEQAHNIILMLTGKKFTETPEDNTKDVTAIPTRSSHDVNKIASEFARLVKAGSKAQLDTMKTWLAANGNARLTDLVKASRVKNQQSYSGVGGSLSKNMLKAGGVSARAHGLPQFPKEWYGIVQDSPEAGGAWHYVIAPELVEPLKAAFAKLPA